MKSPTTHPSDVWLLWGEQREQREQEELQYIFPDSGARV